MKSLWPSYISWSDGQWLSNQIAKVQEQLLKAAHAGLDDRGLYKNHDFLSVELINLQDCIAKIRAKKEIYDKSTRS
jgi:hypothetical protein